jgi:hypothetical protein
MPQAQFSLRLSDEGRQLITTLAARLSIRSQKESGRKTTQAEVVEKALRELARQEKILK